MDIAVVVAAAIFTGLLVFLALSIAKVARGRKPGYFNIGYKPEHGRKPEYFNIRFKSERGTEFCRARLVGKVYRPDNKALYVVEIHPKDAAKAYAWTVLKTRPCGVYSLEKGKFYKLAFKEELYERTKTTP